MNAEQTRSGGSATQGFDLSPRAQAALVEVMAGRGGTPAEVIERAALALRDETTDRAPKARLRQRSGTKRLTRDEINHIVSALTSLA